MTLTNRLILGCVAGLALASPSLASDWFKKPCSTTVVEVPPQRLEVVTTPPRLHVREERGRCGHYAPTFISAQLAMPMPLTLVPGLTGSCGFRNEGGPLESLHDMERAYLMASRSIAAHDAEMKQVQVVTQRIQNSLTSGFGGSVQSSQPSQISNQLNDISQKLSQLEARIQKLETRVDALGREAYQRHPSGN
jgi:hypothetical protein